MENMENNKKLPNHILIVPIPLRVEHKGHCYALLSSHLCHKSKCSPQHLLRHLRSTSAVAEFSRRLNNRISTLWPIPCDGPMSYMHPWGRRRLAMLPMTSLPYSHQQHQQTLVVRDRNTDAIHFSCCRCTAWFFPCLRRDDRNVAAVWPKAVC
jgi:hypothetical protein